MNKVRHAAREIAINALYQSITHNIDIDEALYAVLDHAVEMTDDDVFLERKDLVDLLDKDRLGYEFARKLLKDDPKIVTVIETYARKVLYGVKDKEIEFTEFLEENDKTWTADRLDIVVKTCLFIAMYEMAYLDDIPVKVAINEAIDFVKLYTDEPSTKYVNFVLQKFMDSLDVVDIAHKKSGKKLNTKYEEDN